MNGGKNLKAVVQYWIEKAKDSLDAAEDELKAGRLSFSVRGREFVREVKFLINV